MELVLPTIEFLASLLLIGSMCLLAGYTWGRRVGRREGIMLERTAAPIQLRQLALERNSCPVCGRQPQPKRQDLG